MCLSICAVWHLVYKHKSRDMSNRPVEFGDKIFVLIFFTIIYSRLLFSFFMFNYFCYIFIPCSKIFYFLAKSGDWQNSAGKSMENVTYHRLIHFRTTVGYVRHLLRRHLILLFWLIFISPTYSNPMRPCRIIDQHKRQLIFTSKSLYPLW